MTNQSELQQRIKKFFDDDVIESSDGIELFDTDLVISNIAAYITANYTANSEVERLALEARIDELENNKWLPNEAKWIEQEADRIAELKAQQEEV